jgi:hypothetical protein
VLGKSQVSGNGADSALVFLLVPTVGSFYPLPAYPVYLFPYIFLAYMVVGAGWLFVASRRPRGILREIETIWRPPPERRALIHTTVWQVSVTASRRPW